jgi:3-hydroxy-9,10-secoandrosta-1,3,5(10)-triene-9,17-dione monooxygenase
MAATTTTGMVEAARALVPALRERRLEADELRRLPDASVADLHELGIFGSVLPTELGGENLGVDVLFEVVVALARGDGATSWCGGNWTIHNLLLCMFPLQAQQDVFGAGGSRLPLISTGFSPARGQTAPAEGGQVLSGQWDFASGVDHAEWVVVVAMSERGPLAHLVPVGDLEIIDTWHTGGLRGTGSKDVAASEVFVPEHRLLPLASAIDGDHAARELYDNPFFRVPLTSVFHTGLTGTMIGMAHGALEVFTETITAKVGGLSGIKSSTRPEVHHRIGEAAAEVNAAHLAVRATYAEMREMVAAGSEITMLARTRWRRDSGWAAKVCLQAIDRLFQVGGAHALWLDDQLLQYHRDAHAASHHYGLAYDALFMAHGQAALGQEPTVPML